MVGGRYQRDRKKDVWTDRKGATEQKVEDMINTEDRLTLIRVVDPLTQLDATSILLLYKICRTQ